MVSYPEIIAVAPLIGFEELLLRRRLCQWERDEVDLQSDRVEKQDHMRRKSIKQHRNSHIRLNYESSSKHKYIYYTVNNSHHLYFAQQMGAINQMCFSETQCSMTIWKGGALRFTRGKDSQHNTTQSCQHHNMTTHNNKAQTAV